MNEDLHSHHGSFLVCPVPHQLIEEARIVTKRLREEKKNKDLSKATLSIIVKVTENSLHYYFLRPIELMKLNFIAKGIVTMGVNAGVEVLKTFGGQLIGHLNEEQMKTLADVIEDIFEEIP
ncbi:MAG: hypothetical protein H7A25_11825 [Leptospiraceae bacterium]|nr:hypothetical protein [Leptospiraceae bacterium]MCP5500586.1 hypothetical protein [Leptospiraceae bacterium]